MTESIMLLYKQIQVYGQAAIAKQQSPKGKWDGCPCPQINKTMTSIFAF